MSIEHPIVAITGSSGAGSTSIITAFQHIFFRERVKAAYIQGSAFHRYDRKEMEAAQKKAHEEGRRLSHFGPEGNFLNKLESLFHQYAANGTGLHRHYLHTQAYADDWQQPAGTFTPWQQMDEDTDLLLYRGLHGAAVDGDIDIAQYPDLLIGIVPNVNLEWMRKINRDSDTRGYSTEQVKKSILCRMHDYANHITPQFSRTHINFQLASMADTSNPFDGSATPSEDECILIINFQDIPRPDFQHLVSVLPKSFMSNSHTLVVPGAQMTTAIEVIMMPLIHDLIEKSRQLRGITDVPKSRGAGVVGSLGQSYW